MLWALLFSLILNNDPTFILPKFDKEIKKHVTDKERKNEILEIRKIANKNRKEHLKEKRKDLKYLNQLVESRETTLEEFNRYHHKRLQLRHTLQEQEILHLLNTQNLITENEWQLIFDDFSSSIKKHNKEKDKNLRIIKKNHNQLIKKINKTIDNDSVKTAIHSHINQIYQHSINYHKLYHSYTSDPYSVFYTYNYNETELKTCLKEVNTAKDSITTSTFDACFEIRKLTTPREWKKIMRKLIVI